MCHLGGKPNFARSLTPPKPPQTSIEMPGNSSQCTLLLAWARQSKQTVLRGRQPSRIARVFCQPTAMVLSDSFTGKVIRPHFLLVVGDPFFFTFRSVAYRMSRLAVVKNKARKYSSIQADMLSKLTCKPSRLSIVLCRFRISTGSAVEAPHQLISNPLVSPV